MALVCSNRIAGDGHLFLVHDSLGEDMHLIRQQKCRLQTDCLRCVVGEGNRLHLENFGVVVHGVCAQ